MTDPAAATPMPARAQLTAEENVDYSIGIDAALGIGALSSVIAQLLFIVIVGGVITAIVVCFL